MPARLLIIQHTGTCPPGLLGKWLVEHGIELDVRSGDVGDPIPSDLSEHDGLMVMGGGMGANDDGTHPWLSPTKELIAATLIDEKPLLGVCLGHQLIATAVGGTSAPNPLGKARGLTAFNPNAEGINDPLLSSAAVGSMGLQWNDDVVEHLPDSAVVLATAPDGSVQAVRFGLRAWGVQFHPEATPEIFRGWAEHRATDATWPLEALHTAADEFSNREAEVAAAWEPLAARFAQMLGESATATSVPLST